MNSRFIDTLYYISFIMVINTKIVKLFKRINFTESSKYAIIFTSKLLINDLTFYD